MKISIEYILPEEIEDLELAIYGWKYRHILNELDEELRKRVKYGLHEEWDSETCHVIRQLIGDLCQQKSVDLI